MAAEAKRQDAEWTLSREGANHSIYLLGGETIPIPRHSELGERLAVEIFKECQSVLGKGWWRK
ncbi:MAG TPA: hypothetical protein DGG94_15910 [Micromonosporaceae bacterium]|nr:hypothetical protein [Micromonosporaceae bacterium]